MLERPALRIHDESGDLRSPLLVATFVRRNGFNSTAAATLGHYATSHDAQLIADMNPDAFYDFTIVPPTVRPVEGQRTIDWPKNEFRAIKIESQDRDIIVLAGIEPHLNWQIFATAILDFINHNGITDLVVLRTWPAAVPHTRPTVMRLTSTNEELASQLGLTPNHTPYEGPVDFGGLLSALHLNAGGTSAGLTAIVPNYLGVVPNPHAMIAITHSIDRLAGTNTSIDEFQEAAEELNIRADEEMGRSEDLRRAVLELEDGYEAILEQMSGNDPDNSSDELPSSDEVLRDVERFLQGETSD